MRALIFSGMLLLTACGGGSSVPLPQAQADIPASAPAGDDTANLQAMIDAAPSGGRVNLPCSTLRTSAPLLIVRPIHLEGCGSRSSVVISSATEGIVVTPEAPISQGWRSTFKSFGIQPATPGGGKSAFVVRLKAGAFFSKSKLEDLYLGDFGGPGLMLDNSVGNGDGIFSTVVRDCWIANGVKGILIGDSVTFENNVIPDGPSRRTSKSGAGIGFDLTTVNGSRLVALLGNSVSTSGGGLHADHADGLRVENNWFEYQSYYGIPFSGPSPGLVHISNSMGLVFRGNLLNPQTSGVRFSLALENVTLSNLDSNEFSGTGRDGDIGFLGSSASNRLSGVNSFQGALTGKFTNANTGLIAGSY